jgi:hypothetical protein
MSKRQSSIGRYFVGILYAKVFLFLRGRAHCATKKKTDAETGKRSRSFSTSRLLLVDLNQVSTCQQSTPEANP